MGWHRFILGGFLWCSLLACFAGSTGLKLDASALFGLACGLGALWVLTPDRSSKW